MFNITVTELGEYIRHQSCERRFKLSYNNREIAKTLPFSNRLFNSIDPVLQQSGKIKEDQWEKSLLDQGFINIGSGDNLGIDHSLDDIFNIVKERQKDLEKGLFIREVNISGLIDQFNIRGRIDFLIFYLEEGKLQIKIVECKASRRDRTYHRVQVCVYQILLKKFLNHNEIEILGSHINEFIIKSVVARIDENTNQNQNILTLVPLELDREKSDIEYLLSINGPFYRILAQDIQDLDYYLNNKCDDCVFNVHCYPESARTKALQLLGINPSAVRVLKSLNIKDLDGLASLAIDSDIAKKVRSNSSFSYNLNFLIKKAKARRKTLLGGDEHPDEYKVIQYQYNFNSQLPNYLINDRTPLIRIYMSVNYDYVENRLVSLAAHITKSNNQIRTEYNDPNIYEIDGNNNKLQIAGQTVVEKVDSIWTGNYEVDNGTEKQLIASFFRKVIDKITEVAETNLAPIHFYVWTRNEIKALVEACSRVDTSLLHSFNQLLGCRENLEQLIFSCLQDEVDKRYALGWTGRGLSVVTSLSWFGDSFHWFRKVGREEIYLDRVFTQDIFDFKTDLEINNEGDWFRKNDQGEPIKHKFEIRGRFNDDLTVPYWHAYWGRLPDPDSANLESQVKSAIIRYNNANRPGYLEAFLTNRVYALRWVEEKITKKNGELEKPLLELDKLNNFNLNINEASRAALDFLRLNYHVGLNDWISTNIFPPINRMVDKGSIPLENITINDKIGSADIKLSTEELEIVKDNSSFNLESFVRISPCDNDLEKGQSINQLLKIGMTAKISFLNWESKKIQFDVIPSPRGENRYMLKSFPLPFEYGIVDESVTDFVASRVEKRLLQASNSNIYNWFNPKNPAIPQLKQLESVQVANYKSLLEKFCFSNKGLKEDQIQAILDGLDTRVHLLLGPPGTGKTMTSAVGILFRIMRNPKIGQKIVIAANTHMAVNNLLDRIKLIINDFIKFLASNNIEFPDVQLARVDDKSGNFKLINKDAPIREIKTLSRSSVLIIGGSTSEILKLAEKHTTTPFAVNFLVIDEASMMVFPHFLALSSILQDDGTMLLAGDHRQLSPIVSQDWEKEDRPPIVIYQPYLSAYEAVRNIIISKKMSKNSINQSSLKYTFRLPHDIRNLISRLYLEDGVNLLGREPELIQNHLTLSHDFEKLWCNPTGLYLILHDERESRKSNKFEAEIIKELLKYSKNNIPANSVAVITPHRAQRTLLSNYLGCFSEVDLIDTVERLQGGEKDNIIVSATVSDPSAISENAEFILSLNRANVAFSRAQKKLIIICSKELINFIPSEIQHYDSSLLWKTVRNICSIKIGEYRTENYCADIFTVDNEIKNI
ncbi:hypothetical protein BCY89_17415 [Sphingobacterium siyangense]|uniref:Uncharacterized protein n=1 Tax=Sphingobacterium siyangense TaxID=459529 RepID=A0A420FG93_9SPHI|nr:AAA domain-containing protein [Sphingobacterium siyangense]RKF31928.1 hypothetical protein BCY89_17415 [Sphingobacterium siyangense]